MVIFVFVVFNFFLSLLIGLPYFDSATGHPLEIFFLILSYLSNTFIFYIILIFIAFLFYLFRLPGLFFVFLFFITNLLLAIDVAVYKLFKFHLNPMVTNLLMTKAGWASMDLSFQTKFFIIFVAISLFLIEWFAFKQISKFVSKKNISISTYKKHICFVAIFFLSIIVTDKFMFAWADIYGMTYITKHANTFPFYQPFTIKRFAAKHFGINLNKTVSFKLNQKYSAMNYPKNKIEFSKNNDNLPNIIFIIIDSLRHDMMNKEVTPNIYEFSKKSLVFLNHYSGGNSSRFGVFSIFYGLYGNYWFNILRETKSPVLMDVMIELGYDFKILSSTKLTSPEFNRTIFVNIPKEKIYDEPKSTDKVNKDAEIIDELINYINKPKSVPFFAFVFLDCAHGSYEYPKEFEKFKPTVPSFNPLFLTKENILPVFNKYKNAINYTDFLIGKLFSILKKKNLLKNTIVLVSGDHGEPFFEHGFYGHNQGFSEEAVKVPLVLFIPGHKPRIFKNFTSHNDIPVTILNLLGCKTNPEDYSLGTSLFDKDKKIYVVSASWNVIGIIDGDSTMVVPLEMYNLRGIRQYDRNYKEILTGKLSDKHLNYLIKFQKEATRFLK